MVSARKSLSLDHEKTCFRSVWDLGTAGGVPKPGGTLASARSDRIRHFRNARSRAARPEARQKFRCGLCRQRAVITDPGARAPSLARIGLGRGNVGNFQRAQGLDPRPLAVKRHASVAQWDESTWSPSPRIIRCVNRNDPTF